MKISEDIPKYSTHSDMVTANDAARYLGVSRTRVLWFVEHGRLRATACGNMYLFYKGDLYEFSCKLRKAGRPKQTGDSND